VAKKSTVNRGLRKHKHAVSQHNRCNLCGRPRAYMRKFGICRICFRTLSSQGQVPGVKKASW
jgi:small subunit ribosomal protein S14